MKWNNRLNSVLTKTGNSVFSEDCLETDLRITAKSHKSEVSAVIRSGQLRDSFKNNDELAEIKTDCFHNILNRFIAAGITFDVSADDFIFIDPAQTLKLSDMEFLKLNGAAVLCQLQQSLLMKHLFNHSPGRFEDFAFEIRERESLLTITAKTQVEICFEAVKDVTKKWFAELLE